MHIYIYIFYLHIIYFIFYTRSIVHLLYLLFPIVSDYYALYEPLVAAVNHHQIPKLCFISAA